MSDFKTTHRSLSENEKQVLRRILDSSALTGGAELSDQVAHTRVVGGLPTFLDLRVGKHVPASSCPDGAVPLRAFSEGPTGDRIGEVIVWVSDGYLSGLEYAWFTDETPTTMPPADSLRLA